MRFEKKSMIAFLKYKILKIVHPPKCIFHFSFLILKNDDLQSRYLPNFYTKIKMWFSCFNIGNWQVITLCDHIFCYSYLLDIFAHVSRKGLISTVETLCILFQKRQTKQFTTNLPISFILG